MKSLRQLPSSQQCYKTDVGIEERSSDVSRYTKTFLLVSLRSRKECKLEKIEHKLIASTILRETAEREKSSNGRHMKTFPVGDREISITMKREKKEGKLSDIIR